MKITEKMTHDRITPEEQDEINHADLKELAHYYGGWKELREVIDMLEDNEKEAAFERYYSNPDNGTSAAERAEQQHRIQRF